MIIIFGYVCMESHFHLVNDLSQSPRIADQGSYGPGGSAANRALAAARNGARVNVISTLGNDIFGQSIETFFNREGIQITGLAKSEDNTTGLQVFTHHDDKETESILYLGANEENKYSQIPLLRLDAKALLLLDYAAEPEFSELLTQAKENRALTMVCAKEGTGAIENADYVILESSDIKPSPRSNIVTLSPCRHFAHLVDKSGDIYASQIKPEILGDMIDDSGTLDAFTGSFASCIQAGLPLSGSLRYAHITAWLTGQKFGTNAAIPYLDSVETALKSVA